MNEETGMAPNPTDTNKGQNSPEAPSGSTMSNQSTFANKPAGSHTGLVIAIMIFLTLVVVGTGLFFLMNSGDGDVGTNSVAETTPADTAEQTEQAQEDPAEEILARNTERTADTNSIYTKLEEFHATNNYYPATFTVDDFPGIDEESLIDGQGASIFINEPVADESAALATPVDSSVSEYIYIPFPTGCEQCLGYVLKSLTEEGPPNHDGTPIVKTGLNNPLQD